MWEQRRREINTGGGTEDKTQDTGLLAYHPFLGFSRAKPCPWGQRPVGTEKSDANTGQARREQEGWSWQRKAQSHFLRNSMPISRKWTTTPTLPSPTFTFLAPKSLEIILYLYLLICFPFKWLSPPSLCQIEYCNSFTECKPLVLLTTKPSPRHKQHSGTWECQSSLRDSGSSYVFSCSFY